MNRYEALFPKRQFLVLKSEDLFTNTPAVWNTIQKFLQLEAVPLNGPSESQCRQR